MSTSFAKYQATGNDFIIIDSLDKNLTLSSSGIEKLCNRNLGIGADGLIFVKKSDSADFFMDYYNSDGSKAEMCGNGIRCLASFVYDNHLANGAKVKVETRGGLKVVEK
ncbi:MAG: diaminopimelate epimerase, partial [Actinobacteria bacterium]